MTFKRDEQANPGPGGIVSGLRQDARLFIRFCLARERLILLSVISIMKKTLQSLMGIAIVSLSSCATITRGPSEVFVVDSVPQAAKVQLSNGMTGETPASFKVSRRDTLNVNVSKPGYATRNISVPSQFAGAGGAAMAGNLLFGGVIGAGVDAGTGAMYEHKPNPLNVTLEKR